VSYHDNTEKINGGGDETTREKRYRKVEGIKRYRSRLKAAGTTGYVHAL
jgi:hypothetical protein